jgi:hypothetical protein
MPKTSFGGLEASTKPKSKGGLGVIRLRL